MNKYKWIFLSYILSISLSNYGNGKRIKIENVKSQKNGDSSNNTEISFPSHFGTHVDFPMHFNLKGKSLNDYTANDFIFNNIKIIDFTNIDFDDYLIGLKDLENLKIERNEKIDFLIVKTGYCEFRDTEKYWKNGLGFDVGTANFLTDTFPNLRAIGFDLISLSSYQKRDIGRRAHKEYLIKNDLLIVEDVDLRNISKETKIKELIVSPLRFEHAEGTPVTLIAKIEND